MHDNTEVFEELKIRRLVMPEYDYEQSIVMDAELSDTSYLYRYGRCVGKDEMESARFLNTFSEEEMQAMADTFTEGFRIGFATCNKDISLKSMVEIRYPMGFERMIRFAIRNFEAIAGTGYAMIVKLRSSPWIYLLICWLTSLRSYTLSSC